MIEPGPDGWRRLNRRMLLVHPVVEVVKALPALVVAVFAGHGSVGGTVWALGLALVVAAFGVVRWFTTWYRITPARVELRRGVLRRRTLTAPVDRIRTVDVTSHLLHRLVGLARVVVRAGVSDRKDDEGVVLDGLTLGEASGLRERLLHRVVAVPEDEADGTVGTVGAATSVAVAREVDHEVPAAAAVEDEIVVLDPRWIRYAPFSLLGFASSLVLVGLAWQLIGEAHVDIRSIGVVRAVLDHVDGWPVLLTVAVAAAAVLAFGVLASTVGYLLAFWNFRLTRHHGGSVHVTRGLITTRATSIERRRLRGVEVSEPLLLRVVGGARCLVIATGLRVGRGAERGGEVLLPPAPREVAFAVAEAVLEDERPLRLALARHPVAALRRRLVRTMSVALVAVLGAVVATVALHWPAWPVSVFAVVVLTAAGWLAVDRYRTLGHGLDAGFVVTRFGSVVRRRCAVEIDGVIGVTIRRTFFQRRLGLATVHATTAAGRQQYPIVDVGEHEALRCAHDVLDGLLDQFRVGDAAELTTSR